MDCRIQKVNSMGEENHSPPYIVFNKCGANIDYKQDTYISTYFCTSWHVTQIIITKEAVDRSLFRIAENLPNKVQ